jgi:trehalose-phosphatase
MSTEKHWGQQWTVEPAEQGNGGLANAVRAAQRTGTVDDVIWLGTVGFPTDSVPEHTREDISDKLESEYDAIAVFVSDSDFDGHYAHYCKTILWPVFHYQIPDNPKSKAYEDHSWVYYVNLNQAFADKIIQSYKRGDIIWIHDYHLLLVPGMVRAKLPDAQIGFFLHTAFPSSEVFRCLSVRKRLLEGMLGANFVAFQSPEYQEHFLTTCSRLLTVEATTQGVQLEDHFVNVTSRAIGIDPVGLNLARSEPEVADWIKVMKDRYHGKHLIVARDKLDNVRGVRQKLLGFELFLNKYPEWRENVVLIQVATSSTDNAELSASVSDIVTRIDSQYSTLAHQPLVLLRQDIAFSQYVALLSVADVLMITSLREGMNLTCHEFIVCQDGKLGEKKHGPVILSEFTGSSAVFNGAELSVNPWDYQKMATAIKTALEMEDDEKEKRYNKMSDVVFRHTGDFWFNELTQDLAKAYAEDCQRDTMAIPRLSVSSLSEKYIESDVRVFILDYEGTLASFSAPQNLHLNSPQRVIDALNDLLNDSRNIVYLMSGRMPEQLERLFERVPGLGIIAENGCFVREFGSDEWIAFADLEKMAVWKASVKSILKYYQDRIEGSTIEERHCRLIFHYSKAEDKELADRQIPECANHINEACESQKVRAVPVPSEKMLVIEPLEWTKGSAATHIFDEMVKNAEEQGGKVPDFLLVAGDDREDEGVFQWANELRKNSQVKNVTTVSVGKRNTQAMATLTQGTSGKFCCLIC